jgi:hypothetical protein
MFAGECPECRGKLKIGAADPVLEAERKTSEKFELFHVGLFFTAFIFLIVEAIHFESTFSAGKLFFTSAFCGGVLGFCIARYLIFVKRLGTDKLPRPRFYFMTILTCVALTAAVGSMLNRTLPSKSYSEIVTIVSKHTSTWKGSQSWYIFLRLPSGKESIRVPRDFWEEVSLDEKILLSLREGYFGFPIVEGMSSDKMQLTL